MSKKVKSVLAILVVFTLLLGSSFSAAPKLVMSVLKLSVAAEPKSNAEFVGIDKEAKLNVAIVNNNPYISLSDIKKYTGWDYDYYKGKSITIYPAKNQNQAGNNSNDNSKIAELQSTIENNLKKITQLAADKENLQSQLSAANQQLATLTGTKNSGDEKLASFQLDTTFYDNRSDVFKTFDSYWGPNSPFMLSGKAYSGDGVYGISCIGGKYISDSWSHYKIYSFTNTGGKYSTMKFKMGKDNNSSIGVPMYLVCETLGGTLKFIEQSQYTASKTDGVNDIEINISDMKKVYLIFVPVSSDGKVTPYIKDNYVFTKIESNSSINSIEARTVLIGPYVK